jgi:large subunit ribosomal protein L25
VELDISGLAIGESLTVADLTVPADSEFISEADEVIVSIIAPRVEEEAEAAEEAEDTEAPAEETADAETDTE